ncbi:MauE/DoxX family redox-associated membrane protein [Streptomyces sp. NPDC093544]|uniref:MauE/DoxX family redox-associated membrane protein n=1 Tax=Streptomyces sp. NPDC093544 TaxID=3155200 RepID=UPI00342EFC69
MGVTVAFSQVLLAVIFLVSASLKLPKFLEFKGTIVETLTLPGKIAGILASGVVVSELFTVAVLIIGPAWLGYLSSLVLLSAFTAYLVWILVRHPGASCGCTGSREKSASWTLVARNLILAISAVVGWLASSQNAQLSISMHITIIAPAILTGIFLLHLDEFTYFFR